MPVHIERNAYRTEGRRDHTLFVLERVARVVVLPERKRTALLVTS